MDYNQILPKLFVGAHPDGTDDIDERRFDVGRNND